jgi:hypothetical protein
VQPVVQWRWGGRGDDEVARGASGLRNGRRGPTIGGAIAGPPGALVGGAVGAGAGAGMGDKTEENLGTTTSVTPRPDRI